MRRFSVVGSAWSLVICATLGCAEDPTPQSAHEVSSVRASTASLKGNDTVRKVATVEAKVFVETGGIAVLALLAQSDVIDYVESIIKCTENLEAVVAVCKRNNSVAREKLNIDWLKDRVIVRQLESGVVAVGIQSTFEEQSESIFIVNAVAESFCDREPSRLAKEAQRIKAAMAKELAKHQTQENAEAVRVMNQMFESEHFREMPRIMSKATVVKPH